MEERFIKVNFNGQELKVSSTIRVRSDKWLICLHGIQSNKEIFEGLINQPFFENYSILAIDLVGFGDSDKPTDFSYNLQDQASVIEQTIKKLNIKEAYLIGHSLGGMIGILLLNPLKGVIKAFINAEGNLIFADCGLSKTVASYSYEQFRDKEFEKIKAHIESSKEPSSKLRRKWLEKIPDFVFYRTSISIVEWAKSEKLFKIFNDFQVKRVFIFGGSNSWKANILSSDVQRAEIPNAGHFMLIDNPRDWYEKIEDFLSS